jgi:hypothetical protein
MSTGTYQINAIYSREMAIDLQFCNLYIRKDIVKKQINNNIFYLTNYHSKHYEVKVNAKLYERFQKILKITNNNYLKDIFETLDFYSENKIEFYSIMEEELSEELAKDLGKEIDREILKNLMKLGKNGK